MLAIFLDGESKSGKTAVGHAIRKKLESDGHYVRLLVAGHFFRHLTLLALRHRPKDSHADDSWLKPALLSELGDERLYLPVENIDQLNTPEIDALVSTVGQFDFVQKAAVDWRLKSAERTLHDGVEIMIFDGRNLRSKLTDWLEEKDVQVALELIIFCRPEVAAKRYLSDEGVKEPTARQISEVTDMIKTRRQKDMERNLAAYAEPENTVPLKVGTDKVEEALASAWDGISPHLPRPIRFDNSEVPRDDGLRTVAEVASKSVSRIIK